MVGMPDFEILEHTADIGIRARGETVAQLFAAAAIAVQSVAVESEGVEPRNVYPISVSGEDTESLLVNWLNEVIYYLDARRVVFARFEILHLNGREVRAEGYGEPWDPRRHRVKLVVKAATWHQLKVEQRDGRWVAQIFLDI
jgi:SHS2 domain-containing protein